MSGLLRLAAVSPIAICGTSKLLLGVHIVASLFQELHAATEYLRPCQLDADCEAVLLQVEELRFVDHCLSIIFAAGNCNGDSTCRDDFFSDPVAIGYYKDHVKKLINRVNTFNQRLYRYF